jgi:hypothetical protein
MGLVNGQENLKKSTFLAMTSTSQQNKNSDTIGSISQNKMDMGGDNEIQPEANKNYELKRFDMSGNEPLEIMKEVTKTISRNQDFLLINSKNQDCHYTYK